MDDYDGTSYFISYAISYLETTKLKYKYLLMFCYALIPSSNYLILAFNDYISNMLRGDEVVEEMIMTALHDTEEFEKDVSILKSEMVKFKLNCAITALKRSKIRIGNLEAELGVEKNNVLGNLIKAKELDKLNMKIERERNEWHSKYKEAQAAADTSKLEAKKREDSLKKDLGIEKECVKNIEKTLHEVEERKVELQKRTLSSQELDAKEEKIQHEKQSLSERQKAIQQTEERFLSKTQDLKRFKNELEDLKLSLEKEQRALNEEKLALELKERSLSSREEAVIKTERDLLKKEEDILNSQAKLASKKSDNVQEVITNNEATLSQKNSTIEAELEMNRILDEETIAKKLEHVNSKMNRLNEERKEINSDREKRDNEWDELNSSIEELKVQRERLEKQRELLRADREEILSQIENLKKLEDLKDRLDLINVNEMHLSNLQSYKQKALDFSPGIN